MTFKVNINQSYIAMVAIVVQLWSRNLNEYRGNIATTLYHVFPAGANSQPEMLFFSPLR